MKKLQYLNRIFSAYVLRKQSQLSFWHETSEINENVFDETVLKDATLQVPHYYMSFVQKAQYAGPFDENGVPLLHYHGTIGLQYNPIAIAQYGLGQLHFYLNTQKPEHEQSVKKIADWLVAELKPNSHGVPVWQHHFDFEYTQMLRKPWYSGLAQGQGISLLLRAHRLIREEKYLDAALSAFRSFEKSISQGGVLFEDKAQNLWIEEYITDPPTHILNGMIWALWGIYDLWKMQGHEGAGQLWDRCLQTLSKNLSCFDSGFWSLYDLSSFPIKNLASPFYHRLHLIQLEVLFRLTANPVFKEVLLRWKYYQNHPFFRSRAFIHKTLFKLLYF